MRGKPSLITDFHKKGGKKGFNSYFADENFLHLSASILYLWTLTLTFSINTSLKKHSRRNKQETNSCTAGIVFLSSPVFLLLSEVQEGVHDMALTRKKKNTVTTWILWLSRSGTCLRDIVSTSPVSQQLCSPQTWSRDLDFQGSGLWSLGGGSHSAWFHILPNIPSTVKKFCWLCVSYSHHGFLSP